MALITIDEPKQKTPPKGFALFALGFRPFFLAAAIFAVAYMGIWLATLQGVIQTPVGLSPAAWHGHEMLFGYAVAVIAGFLLTATQNWTGIPMPKDGPLAALFALWLAGRVLPYVPGLPYAVAAMADLLFLPAVLVAVARPVLKVKQARNYAFSVMLLGMLLADGLFQAGALGYGQIYALSGLNLALYLIVLIIVVMGGRVIPYFTERRVNSTARRWPVVEWLAPATTLTVLAVSFVSPYWNTASALLIPLAGAAAIVHAVRLAGWQAKRLWEVPLLWVLHLGYGWIVIGFALDALAAAGLVSPFLALHAYATGAIGVLTLGMMSRVALGHTGRPLETPKIMPWAFAAMNLSAAVRVFGPLLLPAQTPTLHQLGGALWMAAFAAFAVVYAPMLWHPRVDGKPG
jgi:uncharacterized protein involved in response to NO